VHEVVAVVHVNPPGEEVTVYVSIWLAPPKSLGAVHATVTELFPGDTDVIKGAVALLALTVNVTSEELIAK
jgi:hypothetical protein